MSKDLIESLWCRAVSHSVSAWELKTLAEKSAHELDPETRDKIVFNGGVSPSIHLLCSYGLELSLKTAYLIFGGLEGNLKVLGHDLPLALSSARDVGFSPHAANIDFVVGSIDASHRRHHFRYAGKESVQLPELADTFDVLHSLYFQISPLVWGERHASYELPYFDEVASQIL